MKGREIIIKYANARRSVKNKIWDNYRFILQVKPSHFRSVSKTVSISEDLGCWCDWRTYRSWCGITDAPGGFHWEILDCIRLLVRCHGILLGSFVSRLRVTPLVLWYYLHASYLPRAWVAVEQHSRFLGWYMNFSWTPSTFMLIIPLILSMVALTDFS
jgi:hypothetical protein